jgi:NADH-quinone oxidoreductase subunit B
MLIDAMFKLRKNIVAKRPIGQNEVEKREADEQAALEAPATIELKGLMR